MDSRIGQYLSRPGLAGRIAQVVPLTGDASDRRYFRLLVRDESPQVLALHIGAIDAATLPFVRVAELMRSLSLPVPAILGHDDALGILVQQDLGDVTLQAHLGVASPAEHAALYREAVELIAALQTRGAQHESRDYPPYTVAFDVDKLTWELEFFVKHYLAAYRGLALSETQREAFRHEWTTIVEELAAEPRVLCHRDYHSRNLMLHDGRLHIIDFQDARMGPDTYDLASLLRDSYVDLPATQVDELLAYFEALTRGTSGTGAAAHIEFRRRFELMALQRNLKALGTFGYQTTARGNTVYIQYMPRTLSYVRQALQTAPRFGRLHTLLADCLAELR
ncbi:MAG: hypothetical protein FJW29_06215 [Acidobacteria bacterium]|nr:hypothetical protein [Acidobacteriota bacterium]